MSKQIAPTLIDSLYRASFSKRTPFGWKDNATMREALVSARRFMLDEKMSSFLGDLASAAFGRKGYNPALAARMVDQLRVSARLPHPTVWIEYNLRNAQTRSNELLGRPFDSTQTPQVEGWLLQQHPSLETAISMHIVTQNRDGQMDSFGYDTWAFPVMYVWTVNDDRTPWQSVMSPGGTQDSGLATGILNYVSESVAIARSPLLTEPKTFGDDTVRQLIREWVGVVRRAWALLATINDIPVISADVRQTKGFVARGRYRKFLDHKTLTLHVPEKRDTRVIARQLVALARRRAHQVRAHWREDWRNPPSKNCPALLETGRHAWNADNICPICRGHRSWVHEHARGDASLGFVTHDYKVEHGNGNDKAA